MLASQLSIAQIIDPYKPSLGLDSLYQSIQHLDSIFCHNEQGELVRYKDDFTSIWFLKGNFIRLKIGEFELIPRAKSYQIVVKGNDGNKFTFLPEILDIKVELTEDSIISLLEESKNYAESRSPLYTTKSDLITLNKLILLDNIQISSEVDGSFYSVQSAWINTVSGITFSMGKKNKSQFGEFVIGQRDKYILRIFTNKEGIIDFIGIEFKEKYYLWFNFRQKRKTEKLYNIEYILTLDQGENANPLYVPYKLLSYKRSGKMKENRIPVRQCVD